LITAMGRAFAEHGDFPGDEAGRYASKLGQPHVLSQCDGPHFGLSLLRSQWPINAHTEAVMTDLIATIKYLNVAFLAAALSTDVGTEISFAILSLI
jgi:hypothetical protein